MPINWWNSLRPLLLYVNTAFDMNQTSSQCTRLLPDDISRSQFLIHYGVKIGKLGHYRGLNCSRWHTKFVFL